MIRLNLGCGECYCDTNLNVDLDPLVRADLRWDVARLPFEEGSVVEIKAHFLIEHFPMDEYMTLLTRWARLLIKGGTISLSAPDVHYLTQQCRDKVITPQCWARACFALCTERGKQPWTPGPDFKHWHDPATAVKEAIELVGAPQEPFVQWFRTRFFPSALTPPRFCWNAHRNAHSVETLVRDCRTLGFRIDAAFREKGMYFGLSGTKVSDPQPCEPVVARSLEGSDYGFEE